MALQYPERSHQIPRPGVLLANPLQVQQEIPEARQILRQRCRHGGDQLSDVRGGAPARPTVVDGDRQQGRQLVTRSDLSPADQLLIGETGVREDAERHERIVLRLKLQEDQQVQPAAPKAYLAEQIRSALDQAAADAIGREGFQCVEVEFVGQPLAHEVADKFLNRRSVGKDEFVGLVVLSSQSRLPRGGVRLAARGALASL